MDGKRVPYARELWLPLFWIFVAGGECLSWDWNEDLDLLEKSHPAAPDRVGEVLRRRRAQAAQRPQGPGGGLIRKYAYGEIRNNTERFRYQNLTARYNTFNELWTKRLRALEEGRLAGLHGPAAAAAAVAAPAAAARGQRPATPGQVRVQDPQRDTEAVRTLFDRFLEVRKQAGETGAVKFESFQKIVTQQAARILAEKGAQAVEFRLETKDGKVSLKARPVK